MSVEFMLLVRWPFVICPGLRRCHSSTRSRSHIPGKLRGVNAPPLRITFPSALRRHLPSFVYCSTTGQSLIKCPDPPQKLQSPWFGGREGAGAEVDESVAPTARGAKA